MEEIKIIKRNQNN